MSRLRPALALSVRLPALVLVLVLRCYQLLLSPVVGPVCRYAPSCSSYAVTAIRERGAVVGCLMAARRLARCHPWAAGGWDPVPPRRERAPHDHERAHHQAPPVAATTRTPR